MGLAVSARLNITCCHRTDPGNPGKMIQKGGCGGFGKGNFSELFKSIENFEKDIEASAKRAAAAAAGGAGGEAAPPAPAQGTA